MSAVTSSAAPSLAAGLAATLPSFSKLLYSLPPPNSRPPLSGRQLSYLTMQHLVARLPGALLPHSLFPYLGGKRNRETERGPKLACRRPPARAGRSGRSGEGDGSPRTRRAAQATRLRVSSSQASSLCLGSAVRQRSSSAARYYGTAALHPVPRSLASPAATLTAEPCPRAQSPPPPHTRARAQSHAPHTNKRARTHECGSIRWEHAFLWCGWGLDIFRVVFLVPLWFWRRRN